MKSQSLFVFSMTQSYHNFCLCKHNYPNSLTILDRYILYIFVFPKKEEGGHRKGTIDHLLYLCNWNTHMRINYLPSIKYWYLELKAVS